MNTKNPFPGMNPFFEQRWRGAHTALITYLRDALQVRLPPDLIAGPEEEVVTIGAGGSPTTYRPDVQVREPWTLKEPAVAAPAAKPLPITATEPIRVLRKRRSFISGGVNFAEIDLVRQGASVFPDGIRNVLQQKAACYGVCVFRAEQPVEREVYPICLRERLPAIRVPLRRTDADVVLDLQPLIDQCHERGRYHLLDYRLNPDPPLSPEDAAWVDELLRSHHLR